MHQNEPCRTQWGISLARGSVSLVTTLSLWQRRRCHVSPVMYSREQQSVFSLGWSYGQGKGGNRTTPLTTTRTTSTPYLYPVYPHPVSLRKLLGRRDVITRYSIIMYELLSEKISHFYTFPLPNIIPTIFSFPPVGERGRGWIISAGLWRRTLVNLLFLGKFVIIDRMRYFSVDKRECSLYQCHIYLYK